ncbi:50S ribosomal protein L25/general stress protein Ctc [Salirhabdus salicampi]|uniref:50S ribosomal protein L25/general stress protein Ctc n=1 Tax=Salirhabdus salicampi TaxID=476102 RepID=UPI0020C53861|nr:50S ribosomal protein L25/general stress protein Ctc [Salirhabdus salicampi]MCP8618173.1 50S ribosomal protein L25/general stress protein Ctc [Salirhabdus salicampi]
MVATIKATERKDLTRSATRELRLQGLIPAVVYGKGKEPSTLAVNTIELLKTVRDEGKNAVFSLKVEGKKPLDVMLYDYQQDSIKDELLHADFYQVDMSSDVDVEVAINLKGDTTSGGGVLQQTLHQLHVRAKPNKIPDEITIDISSLEIGDSITVGDIKPDQGYEILDDAETTIVTVLPPQNEKVEEEGEEGAEAPAEESGAGNENNDEG